MSDPSWLQKYKEENPSGGQRGWPAILGWDEWEALAMVHQEKLCSDTRGDAPVVTADNLPDPMDVTHRYKPGGGIALATRIRA